MKQCWVISALSLMLIVSQRASAQADLYGQFSESKMTSLQSTQYLPGATVGIMLEGPTLLHHVLISADIQGRFVESSSLKLNGAVVGTRLNFLIKHGLAPYVAFMGGFARLYSNSPGSNFNGSTTDTEIEADAGVAKRITRHWDVTVDYSYARYSALDRMYSPQTFSIGTIFHFQKR